MSLPPIFEKETQLIFSFALKGLQTEKLQVPWDTDQSHVKKKDQSHEFIIKKE